MANILYISYDGMTDPLGQSQVLAYLKPLAAKGFSISLISYEKPEAFRESGQALEQQIRQSGIAWFPVTYHKRPPVVSTLLDIWTGKRKIKQLLRDGVDLIHCRGYIAGLLGLWAHRKFRVPFIFDMRGWWPDEKKEGGYWQSPLYTPVYRYFKRKEAELLKESRITVSLTYAGKKYITDNKLKKPEQVPVIPTCVDLDLFPAFDAEVRTAIRQELGIPEDAFVMLYSGSLGGNYRTDLVLKLFANMQHQKSNVHLLIISQSPKEVLDLEMKKAGVPEWHIHYATAKYSKVHRYLMAGDLGVIFYKDGFSTIGRSPTKLGEYWSCGLPAATIPGMGDLDTLADKYPKGLTVIDDVDRFTLPPTWVDRTQLREYAGEYFGLGHGVEHYRQLYERLLGEVSLATIHYFIHHRPDRSPGQRFRCEQYLSFLEEAGFEVRWHNLLDAADDRLFYSAGNLFQKARLVWGKWWQRWKAIRQVKKGEIAFIYREAFMLGTAIFERQLKRRGAKLVFDFDDAIWLMEVSAGNKKLSFLKRPGKTADICRLSDLVIVGNEYLATYARQYAANVVVIPTTIDTGYHRPMAVEHVKPGVCIGWTGSDTTIKHFETILPVLEQVKALYGDRVYFKLITNRPVQYPSLALEATLWDKDTEVEQLAELDIGIMPLPDDEWSRGKCGFKLLQYMALEKPVVASPVGVNTTIVDNHQNGYLATTEAEWVDRLSALVDDAHLRQLLGSRGRQKVVRQYSVAGQRDKYVGHFLSLVTKQHAD